MRTNPEFAGDGVDQADLGVVDKFLSRLTVFAVPRSRVLQIEFVSRDPDLAARAANTVAAVYLQSQTEAKAEAAKAASAWLARKIADLRAKVADADAKVEAFRAEIGLALPAPTGRRFRPSSSLTSTPNSRTPARPRRPGPRRPSCCGSSSRKVELDEAPASVADESMRRFVEQRVALRPKLRRRRAPSCRCIRG